MKHFAITSRDGAYHGVLLDDPAGLLVAWHVDTSGGIVATTTGAGGVDVLVPREFVPSTVAKALGLN